MEVTRFRAMKMGLDFSTAWDRMVVGIGRKSKLILDDLGIVGLKMTETTDTSAIMAQVIEEGQRQIADAGGIPEDYAQSFEQLDAAVKNLKESLGMLLAPAAARAAQGMADTVNVWTKNFQQLDLILQKLDERAAARGPGGIMDTAEVEAYTETMQQMPDALRGYTTQMNSAAIASSALGDTLFEETMRQRELNYMRSVGQVQMEGWSLSAALWGAEVEQTTVKQTALQERQMVALLRLSQALEKSDDSFAGYIENLRLLNYAQSIGAVTFENYGKFVDILRQRMEAKSKADMDAIFAEARLGSLRRQGLEDLKEIGYAAQRAAHGSGMLSAEQWDAWRAAGAFNRELEKQPGHLYSLAAALSVATDAGIGYTNATAYSAGALADARAAEIATRPGVMKAKKDVEAMAELAQEIRDAADLNKRTLEAEIRKQTSELRNAMGLGDLSGPFDPDIAGPDRPAEPIRRLAAVAERGEGEKWTAELRDQLARAWEVMRPGQGVGEQILGDEGAMKRWAGKLVALAESDIGPGVLQGLETATGDEWINQMALASELGVRQGIQQLAEQGFETLTGAGGLNLPINFTYGTEGEGEGVESGINPINAMAREPINDGTLITDGEMLGTTLREGLWAGLSMEGADGATGPLMPLLTDLDTAYNKVSEFEEKWTGLSDRHIYLYIHTLTGGEGEAQHGGIVGGLPGQPVPIIAHAGEVVLNRDQQRIVGAMMGRRGGGGSPQIVFNNPVFLGREAELNRVVRRITPVLDKYSRRR
jgi:hypothetical protein